MGFGTWSDLHFQFGEEKKHLNWTPEVAFQHAGIRSGLVLNLLWAQPQLRGSLCQDFLALPRS